MQPGVRDVQRLCSCSCPVLELEAFSHHTITDTITASRVQIFTLSRHYQVSPTTLAIRILWPNLFVAFRFGFPSSDRYDVSWLVDVPAAITAEAGLIKCCLLDYRTISCSWQLVALRLSGACLTTLSAVGGNSRNLCYEKAASAASPTSTQPLKGIQSLSWESSPTLKLLKTHHGYFRLSACITLKA